MLTILGIIVAVLLFVIASIQWKHYMLAKEQDIEAFNKKQKEASDINFLTRGGK